MKTPTRTIPILAALALTSALLALPQNAFAVRTVATLFAVPASTNVTVGLATNVTANVIITNGTGGSTRYVGTCTLSVSVSGPDSLVTASISPTNLIFPASTFGTNATLSVAAQAGFSAGTYTVFIVADTNPPNATVITPKTNTFIVNPPVVINYGSRMYWTSPGINTNWSTGTNWTPNGPPVSTNEVLFVDAGATNAAGVVNNVVDANSSVGSLTYGQTNGFHTTQINPGLALTVGGTNGFSAGTGSDANIITVNSVQGAGGALLVTNNGANFVVSQSHAADNPVANAQLDLSGLDTFQAKVARLVVGADLSIKGAAGTLKLARTNTIALTTGSTAPQLDVGEATLAQGIAGTNSTLLLGQTNGFLVDSIAVGRGKNVGTGGARGSSMRFNSAFSSPTAYFRGTAGGSSRVATWSIGDGSIAKGSATATNDFSLGSLDAFVDTMFVGRGANVSGGSDGAGTLSIGAGTLDVNTLNVGRSEVGAGHGTINVNGGLVVVNTTLVLANNNSSVNSDGTLNITGTVTANNGITIGGGTAKINLLGGTLNATNNTATIGTVAAPLAFLTLSNSMLSVPVRNLTPAGFVNTDLATFGDTNTINVSSLPPIHVYPAQLAVIQVDPAAFVEGTFNVGLGTLPPGSFQGYISNNLANYTVDLVLSSGPVTPILEWDGASSGDWDLITQNWKTNSVLTTYSQGYPLVQFDDTLTGTNTVNLTTILTPGTLTVTNSSTNYTFTGSGKLSGTTGLTKQGSGSLTLGETGGDDFSGGILVADGTLILANNNTISGGTTIGSGATLQVGSNGVTGNLPSGAVADAGALVFERNDDVTVPNSIAGGTLTQNGNDVLTLSGTNSATITVALGTLKAGSLTSLGTAGVTVNKGAALDVNAMAFNNAEPITVSGAGGGGNGSIVNSGTNQTKVLRVVTLATNATFGGNGDWDIRSSQTGSTVNGDGQLNGAYTLTKVGTNTVTLFGVQVDAGLADIDVQAGTLSVERNTTGLGNPTNTVRVFTNATLQFQSTTSVWNKVVILKDGATFKNAGLNATFAGPVALESGIGTITANSAQFTLTNVISGAGALTKNGTNTLVLTSSNAFSGSTLISAGTLALSGAGAVANSPVLSVASGATLDATGRSDGTLTLGSGQTLNGNGLVLGMVVASTGSAIAPGSSVGILSISNNLTLQAGSTTTMELDKGNQTNDLLRGLTSISYGGTLSVTNLSGTLAAGDSFQLFQAPSYANSFAATNLPDLAAGLGWTNTLATDGRIAVISVVNLAPTNIVTVFTSPNTLDLSWPADHTGWTLQAQTNSADVGLSTNWVPMAGSASTNHVPVTIDPANGTVFYRLVYP